MEKIKNQQTKLNCSKKQGRLKTLIRKLNWQYIIYRKIGPSIPKYQYNKTLASKENNLKKQEGLERLKNKTWQMLNMYNDKDNIIQKFR